MSFSRSLILTDPLSAETPPPPYSMMEAITPEEAKQGDTSTPIKLVFSAPHTGKYTLYLCF